MTDLNPYNICIHDGSTYIVIGWNKMTMSWTNELTTILKPVTGMLRGTTTPETQTILINLNKINKLFTITSGHIIQGMQEYAVGSNETKTTAKDKRNALIDLLESGKTLTLIYDGTSYDGVIKKLEIRDEARDIQATPNTGDAVYELTLGFIIGIDRIATT